VKREGKIITNHHVVEPWWNDEDLKQLLDHGASAYVLSYEAYFPGKRRVCAPNWIAFPRRRRRHSSARISPPANSAVLELDDRNEATVTGEAVVLIGYPTGIEAFSPGQVRM